jgi:mono/diheme cytochrome c family protein
MKMQHLVIGIVLGAAAVACSKSEQNKPMRENPQSTQQQTAVAPSGAKELFEARCSPCHGMSGKGDGPAAAALNPKPRDYTNKSWQGSITDEELKKVIVGGGASVGKSPAMPPNPDLAGKPELDGLVAVVRSFGK